MSQEIFQPQSFIEYFDNCETTLAELENLVQATDGELLLLSNQTKSPELNFRVQKLADCCKGITEICGRLEKIRNNTPRVIKSLKLESAQAEELMLLAYTIQFLLDNILDYHNAILAQIKSWQESAQSYSQPTTRPQKLVPKQKFKNNTDLASIMSIAGLASEITAATGVASALKMRAIANFWDETVDKATTGLAKNQKDKMIQQAKVLSKSNVLINYCYLNKEFAEFILLTPYAYGITEKQGFNIALCHNMVTETMWERAKNIDLTEVEALLAMTLQPEKELDKIKRRVKNTRGKSAWQAHEPWPIKVAENSKQAIKDLHNYIKLRQKAEVKQSGVISEELLKEKSILDKFKNLFKSEIPSLEAKRESLRKYFCKRYTELDKDEQLTVAFSSPSDLNTIITTPMLYTSLQKIMEKYDRYDDREEVPERLSNFHKKWHNHKDYKLVKDFVLMHEFLLYSEQRSLAMQYADVADYYMDKSYFGHWKICDMAQLAQANKKFALYLATNPLAPHKLKNIEKASEFSWTPILLSDLEIAKLAAGVDHMGFGQLNREQVLELAKKGLSTEIFDRCVKTGRWLEYEDYYYPLGFFGVQKKIKPCLTLDDWVKIAGINPILAEGILANLGGRFEPKQTKKLLAHIEKINLMRERSSPTEEKEVKKNPVMTSLVCSSSFSWSSSALSSASSSSSSSGSTLPDEKKRLDSSFR